MSDDSNHQSIPQIQANLRSGNHQHNQQNNSLSPTTGGGFSLGGVPQNDKRLKEKAAEEADQEKVQSDAKKRRIEAFENPMAHLAEVAGMEQNTAGKPNARTATSAVNQSSQNLNKNGEPVNPTEALEQIELLFEVAGAAVGGGVGGASHHMPSSPSGVIEDGEDKKPENGKQKNGQGKSRSPSPDGNRS